MASYITDPVTTTDELIPSGETSSYRSNPLGLAEFTLSRKDPAYVGRAKAVQAEEAARLAKLAQANGIDGIVCSPMEAHDMRELLGPDALIVTPGVRPVGAALGDQSRVATPSQAIERGASHIVVGRPITGADDPVAAFDAIVAELVENVA